jgi:enoyl-[acyl-carrier protein] reductase I
MSGIMAGKKILIMGLRNKWSIAWGITKKLYCEGAELAFTCEGEREEAGVRDLVASLAEEGGGKGGNGADGAGAAATAAVAAATAGSDVGDFPILKCNLADDAEIDAAFAELAARWGKLDGVVHAIAHARTEDLQNDFIMTSREGFLHALNISAYTLVAVARKASELMAAADGSGDGDGSDGAGGAGAGGSILTLTYMGSERVFPGYNVMGVAKAALEATVRYLANSLGPKGIRVNAISSGPIKTLSSKAVKNFSSIMTVVDVKAPLRRGVDADEVGGSALYLLSDLSSAVTGEIHYVDSGFNIMGV